MIRLIDNYVIQSGPYDYMLARDTGRRDKKTGTPDLVPISYHGSVRSAIVALREYCIRKSLGEMDGSLSDAICVLRTVDKQFEDLLNQALEKEKVK